MEQQEQKRVLQSELLEKGMVVIRKVLDEHEFTMNREQMFDYVNFELTMNNVITQVKTIESKSPEELRELAKKSIEADMNTIDAEGH